jgi:hypothetical protein
MLVRNAKGQWYEVTEDTLAGKAVDAEQAREANAAERAAKHSRVADLVSGLDDDERDILRRLVGGPAAPLPARYPPPDCRPDCDCPECVDCVDCPDPMDCPAPPVDCMDCIICTDCADCPSQCIVARAGRTGIARRTAWTGGMVQRAGTSRHGGGWGTRRREIG